MSERGKRVFRFLLDPERDADVIGRIEERPSMTGYVRELVRRDMHDERLNFAALKASELQSENAKLRELVRDMWHEGAFEPGACYEKAVDRLEERTRELGIEVGR